MTIKYTVYSTTTGEIIRTGTAMTEATANLQGSAPGTRVVLEGHDPVTQAIDPNSGSAVQRLVMSVNGVNTRSDKTAITANGTDVLTISPVPVGAEYDVYLPANLGLIQPPDGVVNDGKLEITTTVPGIYSLRIAFQTFLDFTVTFNAN